MTGVTDISELPCQCWESDPSLLEEKMVLLSPEPFSSSVFSSFKISLINIHVACTEMEMPIMFQFHNSTLTLMFLN